MLESAAGLRFSPEERFPFFYHLDETPPGAPRMAPWPRSEPPAGYTGDSHGIRPSTLATALIRGWGLRMLGTSKGRLFKAALWQVKVAGLESALTLLFDLLQAGFTATDDVRWACRLLLHGRCRAGSDEAMVTAFLDGTDAEASSWRSLAPDAAWLDTDAGEVRAEGHIISALLARGAQEIDRVRSSGDYDAWHVGQIQLCKLLPTIHSLVDEFLGVSRLPLSWRAKLSQWEEISSDGVGVFGLANFPDAPLPSWNGTEAKYAAQLMERYRARGGGNWRSRFFRERLLVPDGLRERILDDATLVDAPEEWSGLSRRVIRPWMAANRSFATPDRSRSAPIPAEDLVNHPAVKSAFRTLGVADQAEQVRMTRAYIEGDSFKRPTASPFMRRLDSGDESEEQVPVFYINLGLQKPSSEEQRVFDALNEVLPSAQAEYIENEQTQEIEAELRIRTYPYSMRALIDAVVQRVAVGDTEQAIEGLIDLVVLEPTAGPAWRSLAGLLADSGHEREASLAELWATAMQLPHE